MYCSKCGNNVSDGAAFCPACGQSTGATIPAGTTVPASAIGSENISASGLAYTNYAVPPVIPAAPAMVYGNSQVQFAGFWLRVLAYILDTIVIGVASLALFIPFAMMTGLGAALGRIHGGEDPRDIGAELGGTFALGIFTIIVASIIGTWLYHALMESSAWEATLGKRALKLRVTGMNGERITFARATGRHFGKIVTGLIPLGIGFALAGFTEKRQAIHDMLASCLVLRDT